MPMDMNRTALAISLASILLPLAACSDDPSVEASITPLACGRQQCDLAKPLAVGSHLAFQAQPLGLAASVRVSDPALARVTPGYNQAEEGYTLDALAAGDVTVELLDDDGAVIGSQLLHIAAADHLEATLTVINGSTTTQLDRITAEQPQQVPASATVRISIDQRKGADPLYGWTEYDFTPALTGGARVVRWDREGNATIDLAAGDQAVTWSATSTTLSGRFMLDAR
jgi:hypothetical protein